MDVKALYPSLRADKCRSIIEEVVINSDVKLTNVDWKKAALYWAIVFSKEEIAEEGLEVVIPLRFKGGGRGRKVTLAYLEKDKYPNGEEKWDWSKCLEPSEKQRKVLMAKMLGKVVHTLMGNHLYQFSGKVYRQAEGGPIGLELTGVVADIVMTWYDKKFINIAGSGGLVVHMYKRYVDDVNMVVEAIGGEIAEGEREAEERTARFIKVIADEVIPGMIVMEVDAP